METKELKINVPEGYEIDRENSTLECIKFNPIQNVKTWKDIKTINGVYINSLSDISPISGEKSEDETDTNIFIDEKHAKSALAMAQISQLMPYYGGAITNEEWNDVNMKKYCIENYTGCVSESDNYCNGLFLAFRTMEQRERFMSYPENIQLVKDYLMID